MGVDPNGVYTLAQVGAICGVKEGAVRKWVRDKKLPASRPGRRYLVLGSSLLSYLAGKEAVGRPIRRAKPKK